MNLDKFVMIWKEWQMMHKLILLLCMHRKRVLIFGWWNKLKKILIDNNDENPSKMDISKMNDI
jgi:nicotinic acid mononucleotide adenylyltransferase